jgi:hypothetical protein
MRALPRLLLGTVVVSFGACGGGQAPPPADGSSTSQESGSYVEPAGGSVSEAERTREMEARAAEMERGLAEARAAGASGEDAVEAWEKYEAERAELNRTAAGESAPAENEPYSPPPPEP